MGRRNYYEDGRQAGDLAPRESGGESVDEETLKTIASMFEQTHELEKGVVITDLEIVKVLRQMKNGTPLQKATIELRSDTPDIREFMEGGKVIGAKSTTIGKYGSDGCYNVWFEKREKKFVLAHSKVPLGGNVRS